MSTLLPALAWALLDFVWQGMLVGWGAALLLAAMRKSRPQARYAVACGALLLCAALPLAGLLERSIDAQDVTTALLPLVQTGQGAMAGDGTVSTAVLMGGGLAEWEQALQSKLPLVILLWSFGAGLLALRMALGLAWVGRLTGPGRYRADPAWQARIDSMARRFGIARPVALGLADGITSPVTAGWWRPVVLVPAALVSGMPPHLLEALLAHELAHIRRHDYLVNLVQGAIEIVLFYHPTVWWLSNRIRIEREQIADDLAASMLGEPRRLALALSELDQFQLATPHLAHAAHGGNLMSRIKRLVRPDAEPLNWKMALPVLGLAAACAGLYAHAQTPPPKPPVPAVPAVPPVPAPPHHSDMPAPPAPPAPPAVPAPPAPPEWSVTRAPGELSYAIVRADERGGTSMNGDSSDFNDLKALKRKVKGEFLWFRDRAGKAWIVQDAGIMARVHKAWEPLDRLGKQMDVHSGEMEKHSKVMDALGREMEAAGGKGQDGAMRDVERKMKALGREQEKLGREMEKVGEAMADATPAQRAGLQRDMNRLAAQMEVLSRQMDEQTRLIQQAHKPMEAIGARMEKASQPMGAIGQKMGALGKQIERESRTASRTVRALIDEAQSKGLARPAPEAG